KMKSEVTIGPCGVRENGTAVLARAGWWSARTVRASARESGDGWSGSGRRLAQGRRQRQPWMKKK
ncbi:hypothetical protein A2U01_0059377, partial [Trifolium medium]|nr:hypothetical protein [Trifolium medium]